MSTPKREAKEEKGDWPFITYHPDRKRPWLVDARVKSGGKEGSRKFFETKRDAETFAAQCRIKKKNQGTSAFDDAELAEFGWTIDQAKRFALAHLRAMKKSVTIEKAAADLVEARKGAGRNEEYCDGLEARLKKFRESFPGETKVSQIDSEQIDRWLAGLACAPATRNTFRRDVCTLFSFCEKRGWVQKNPAMQTELATDIDKPPGILTPAEAAGLLGACDDDLIPYTAISLFAGLRAAEVEKLDWSEVDLEGGHIEVKAAKAKTQRRRLVPVADNLRAWLKDHVKKAGAVTPANLRRKLDASRRAVGFGTRGTETEEEKKAGVKLREWPSNAMRHSFASYRLAQCQDTAKVALEMGNSPAIVFAHYRELVKPKAAGAYWGIMPGAKGGNVVAFAEAAA
jgi:integrase